MRLDAFFIADAVASPGNDGKFYIHGGGLSRYEVPVLPFPMPLSVFIRFAVSEDELLAGHQRLLLTLVGPTGNPNIPPIEILHEPEADLPPVLEGEQRFLQLAITLPAMVIREGLYQLELRVDGRKVRSMPLPVKVADPANEVQDVDARLRVQTPEDG